MVTHALHYKDMESKSTVNTSSFGKAYHDPKRVDIKLLAIDKLADTILQEFDPEALEFKDFSSYQDVHIKKDGRGYPVHHEEYRKAPVGNKGWALAPLYYEDKPFLRNSRVMPKTTKLIKWIGHTKYAGVTSLNPGFGLDWHHDDDPQPFGRLDYKPQMRCFYTLQTDGKSYIEVQEDDGVDRRYFLKKEFVLFRTHKKHRVWNDGTEPRYSLVIDVW